ncbi:hypothetical protein HU200_008536 [Digitaria exilis]|uniref:Uncharacterized protein n=1 Tax=Digitaria exilis TaxID=1010633 RepID=A0A835KQ08_9POAL|nr:hypothetical protein HU200_008536 [Digitaria exilis]
MGRVREEECPVDGLSGIAPPTLVSSSICHEIVGFFFAIFLCV